MDYNDVFIICVFGVMFGIVLSIVFWSCYNGISPMPSTTEAVHHLIKMLPTDISGNIYELGAGWGSLTLPLSKKYPKCHVKAYENSWIPFFVIWLLVKSLGQSNVSVYCQNFFAVPFHDASLVVCYLYPGAMEKLTLKFKELPIGSFVISNTFAVPGWEPISMYQMDDLYRTKIYLYRRF